jgi:hypothetical protein
LNILLTSGPTIFGGLLEGKLFMQRDEACDFDMASMLLTFEGVLALLCVLVPPPSLSTKSLLLLLVILSSIINSVIRPLFISYLTTSGSILFMSS